jgi:hypothetical protein
LQRVAGIGGLQNMKADFPKERYNPT